jgi:hypoxanthine phosphoribosyltransferase
MAQIKDEMIKYIGKEEINELVQNLARQIESDYKGKELVLVCALKGSVLFAADLMRAIDLPQQIDFVHVVSSSNPFSGGSITIIKDLTLNVAGKEVLIVEEIIDTGKTLSFLKNRILASAPASVRIVTLLDKPARRVISIKADYIGQTIEDRYVVGYGLDEDEVGRNYSDIYYLRH